MISEGVVAFCNLMETEKYKGQDTGKFSLVVNMDDQEAEALKAAGVVVRGYDRDGDGVNVIAQRKFVTKFPDFPVLDREGNVTSKHIPFGSKVKILWTEGPSHPVHGVSTYIKKVKVLELADRDMKDADEEDF